MPVTKVFYFAVQLNNESLDIKAGHVVATSFADAESKVLLHFKDGCDIIDLSVQTEPTMEVLL